MAGRRVVELYNAGTNHKNDHIWFATHVTADAYFMRINMVPCQNKVNPHHNDCVLVPTSQSNLRRCRLHLNTVKRRFPTTTIFVESLPKASSVCWWHVQMHTSHLDEDLWRDIMHTMAAWLAHCYQDTDPSFHLHPIVGIPLYCLYFWSSDFPPLSYSFVLFQMFIQHGWWVTRPRWMCFCSLPPRWLMW